MLTKHFHLAQDCILPFSNIEWGNRAVDTHSVSITIMISWFWHFPKQFVHNCGLHLQKLHVGINYVTYLHVSQCVHAQGDLLRSFLTRRCRHHEKKLKAARLTLTLRIRTISSNRVHFNKNLSMRAVAKFCQHEQGITHLIFPSKSSKGLISQALVNWMRPFDTLNKVNRSAFWLPVSD